MIMGWCVPLVVLVVGGLLQGGPAERAAQEEANAAND